MRIGLTLFRTLVPITMGILAWGCATTQDLSKYNPGPILKSELPVPALSIHYSHDPKHLRAYYERAMTTYRTGGNPHAVVCDSSRLLVHGRRYTDNVLGAYYRRPFQFAGGLLLEAFAGKSDALLDEYAPRLSRGARAARIPGAAISLVVEAFVSIMGAPFVLPQAFVRKDHKRGIFAVVLPMELVDLQIARAESLLQIGRINEAITLYKQTLSRLEIQREAIRAESFRIGFQRDVAKYYQRLIRLLIEENRLVEAFEFVERTKSRSLSDLLGGGKVILPPGLAEAARDLRDAEAATELAMQTTRDETLLTRSIDRGLAVRTRVLTEYPVLELETARPPISLSDLARRIGRTTLVITFFPIQDEYWAMAIRDATILSAYRCGSIVNIERTIERWVRKMSQGDLGIDSDSPSTRQLARTLYTQLIAPGLPQSDEIPHVCVIPSGGMSIMPFGALHDGRQYLASRFSLSALPNATVAEYCYSHPVIPPKNILMLANPTISRQWSWASSALPGTAAEAQAIAKLFPDADIRIKDDASPSPLFTLAHGADVVHLATHAAFDPQNPFTSVILLSPDQRFPNGALTAAQAFELSIKPGALVVLSCCETGLGRILPGDESLGFSRALFFAGAGTIVASLWRVEDAATAQLMTRFYQHLKQGDSRVHALAKAQRELMKTYPSPFFWAPFILVGRD